MTPDVILFELPVAESREPGEPERIRHGCDYDFDGSSMSYYYNFLVYEWDVGGEEVMARAYLDFTYSSVALFAPFERVAREAAFEPIVKFLQRRFLYIKTFERSGAGYVLRYKMRDAPDPVD